MIYRIKLYSFNFLRGGDWRFGEYDLNLFEQIPDNYQVCVESFDIIKTSNSFIGICVGIQNLSQKNTYNTSTKSQMTNLFTNSTIGFNNEITSKSIGIPLNDSLQFQNKVRIIITFLDNSEMVFNYFTGSPQWTMQLCILPIPVSLLN